MVELNTGCRPFVGGLRDVAPLVVAGAGVWSSRWMRLVGVLILISCVVLLVLFGSHVVALVCPSGRRIVVGSWG